MNDPLTVFQTLVEAKSPPGWEDSVKRMKKHPEIDNPWALCLAGETEIPCLDGQIQTVQDLAELEKDFWLYSIDPSGLVVPGLARARFSGLKRVVEIELDNGRVLRCSPDHRWVMRDGSFVAAGELVLGASLMPFRVKHGASKKDRELGRIDHERVYHPGLASYSQTHWAVMRAIDPAGCLTGDHQVHHKNHNPRDNTPENLQRLTRKEHSARHPERIRAMRAGFDAKHADPEFARSHAEKARQRSKEMWENMSSEERDRRTRHLKSQARAAGHAAGRKHTEKAARRRSGGNHKVVRVEKLAEVLPMFDVAVDGWHTFAVTAGVFSHNSWWMKNKGYKPHKKKKDAMSEVTEFQDALIARRVMTRVAKVHPSESARREYLFDHPNADPKNHSVATDADKGRAKADKDTHNESVKGDVDELNKEKAALKKQLSQGTSLDDPKHEKRLKEIDEKIKGLKKQPKKEKEPTKAPEKSDREKAHAQKEIGKAKGDLKDLRVELKGAPDDEKKSVQEDIDDALGVLKRHGVKEARTAMEHPSEEARKKYLQEHRDAEPRNHTVKKQEAKGERDQFGRDKKNQTSQLRHLVNNQKEQLRQDKARLKRLKGDEAKDLASDIALDETEIAKNESSIDKLKSASDPLADFQDALMARRVARRFMAFEHDSEEARKKYLHDHPGASPSRHTVKNQKSKPSNKLKGSDPKKAEAASVKSKARSQKATKLVGDLKRLQKQTDDAKKGAREKFDRTYDKILSSGDVTAKAAERLLKDYRDIGVGFKEEDKEQRESAVELIHHALQAWRGAVRGHHEAKDAYAAEITFKAGEHTYQAAEDLEKKIRGVSRVLGGDYTLEGYDTSKPGGGKNW